MEEEKRAKATKPDKPCLLWFDPLKKVDSEINKYMSGFLNKERD